MAIEMSKITIIGGGVVGLSVALGLLQAGRMVTVLDGTDNDLRASQGNFGLIWLQGKGAEFAPYAKWTREAVSAWSGFAEKIEDLSGENLALEQYGGFEFFTDEKEFSDFTASLKRQKTHLGGRIVHEYISGDDLRRTYPGIGGGVVGATYCKLDGHVNPLRLLKALRSAVVRLGGQIVTDAKVHTISPATGGGFDLLLQKGDKLGAEKIILCAGLGNAQLSSQLGFVTQVRPPTR